MDRAAAVGLALVGLGVAGLLSPVALYDVHEPHYTVSELGYSSVAERGTAVPYDDLSAAEREVLDGADVDDGRIYAAPPRRDDVVSADEWRRMDGLRNHEYVDTGSAYQMVETGAFRATRTRRNAPAIAAIGMGLGAALSVIGGVIRRRSSLRPFEPVESLAVPLASSLALLGFRGLYRTTYAGATGGAAPTGVYLLAAVWYFSLGTAIKGRSLGTGLGAALVPIAVGYRWTNGLFPEWPQILLAVAVVGVPFLVAGHVLSRRTGVWVTDHSSLPARRE